MAIQDPKSPTPAWRCSNGHAEFENSQYQCKYCLRTYNNYLKDNNKIQTGQRILLFSSIAALAAGFLVIWAGLYVRQKFAEADRTIIQLNETTAKLSQVKAELERSTEQLKRVPELEKLLADIQTELKSSQTRFQTTQSNLAQTKATLTQTKNQLQRREQQVAEGSKCVKLMREINNVIWQGAGLKPTEIVRIQQNLQSLGFYQGEIDGTFTEITVKAVNDFQQNCEAKLEHR